MYKKLYTFLEKKELIYSFQFIFRQKHSTTHALIENNSLENLKQLIRKLNRIV